MTASEPKGVYLLSAKIRTSVSVDVELARLIVPRLNSFETCLSKAPTPPGNVRTVIRRSLKARWNLSFASHFLYAVHQLFISGSTIVQLRLT